MEKNIDKDENELLIYTILLNISDNFFTSHFGINRQEGIKIMNKIAKIGDTNELFEIQTPEQIDNVFIKIASAINPKYGLKIN
jgi:hypothetical protein